MKAHKQVRLTIEVVIEAESDRDPKEWARCVEMTFGEVIEDTFGDVLFFEVDVRGEQLPPEPTQ